MEFKNLFTFQTIVEEGSFTAAAEKLNYTQSTITFQIGQLEKELSVSLFEKVGRKMVLTSAGQRLIPYVKEILGAVDKLDYFEKEMEQCCGALHIGAAETYLCYQLPKVLKGVANQAPKAKLFIRSMNCYEIRNELIAGNLDVGIFYQDVGGLGDTLVTIPLGVYPVVLVASPNTARKFSDFTTPEQQLQIPLIIDEPNCIFRQIFEAYLKRNAIILDHTIELGSISTIKNLVMNDVGISFLPRYTVEKELMDGSLAAIPTNIEHREISAVCAYHKNKWMSPLMKLFMDELKRFTGNGPAEAAEDDSGS